MSAIRINSESWTRRLATIAGLVEPARDGHAGRRRRECVAAALTPTSAHSATGHDLQIGERAQLGAGRQRTPGHGAWIPEADACKVDGRAEELPGGRHSRAV